MAAWLRPLHSDSSLFSLGWVQRSSLSCCGSLTGDRLCAIYHNANVSQHDCPAFMSKGNIRFLENVLHYSHTNNKPNIILQSLLLARRSLWADRYKSFKIPPRSASFHRCDGWVREWVAVKLKDTGRSPAGRDHERTHEVLMWLQNQWFLYARGPRWRCL